MSSLTVERVRVGGPYFYGLRADSDIGGEVYERMLLERLPEHGIELTLGVPLPLRVAEPDPAWTIDSLGRIPGRGDWLAAPVRFAPYVARLLKAGRLDLLRGHSVRYCGPSLLAGRRLARSGCPMVLHHHHLSPRWGRLEARILAGADAVVAVSEHARQELMTAGVPAHRIHVILQGVARPPVTDGWPGAWPGAGLRLLALGRLEARKHPELALDALAILRDRGVEASLVVAGAGPLAGAIAQRASVLGLGDRVSLLGRVSDPDKWRLYDSAEVLVFGSELEGFGVVVAEAQSRGVPVLAATGTASAEAFAPGRSGLLAEPTPEAFAAALMQLGDPATHRRMAAAARAYAAKFDWDTCAAEVASLYRALASSAAREASRSVGD